MISKMREQLGIGLLALTICYNVKSFLNCGKCCDRAYGRGRIFQFREGYCQRQKEQQQSCCFVHHRMQGYKLLFRNISTYDIADFNNRNYTAPYPQPQRNIDCRQQLKQRYHYKNRVGSSIQLVSKLAGTVCFSGDCTVDHITKTTEEIYDIKCPGKSREKQQ